MAAQSTGNGCYITTAPWLPPQQAASREAEAAAARALHAETLAAAEKSVQALLPPLKASLDKAVERAADTLAIRLS